MLRILGGKDDVSNYRNDDGRLLIDCGKCDNSPDIGNAGCITCVSRIITKSGEPERIILRSGQDIEYSGDVVRLMSSLSNIDALANAMIRDNKRMKRCTACSKSPSKLLSSAWMCFPDVDMSSLRSELNAFESGNKECEACIMRSYRSSEQLEHALEELKRECARCAFNLVGV